MSTKSETKVNVKTKTDMLKFLEATLPDVSDSNLSERVSYTLKVAAENIKGVLKSDLLELVNEVADTLSDPVPVENQVKTDTADKAKTAEKPKAKLKKKSTKEIEVAEPEIHVNGYLPSAKVFPEVIEHEDFGTLKIAKFRNYDEVVEALDSGTEIFIANYWTKKHIKQYGYSTMLNIPTNPKEFKHDLDICMAIVHTESFKRLWAMSQYTEGMFFYEEEDFEYVEDTDAKTGEKFEVRVSQGMEFEIYVHAEESEVKDET